MNLLSSAFKTPLSKSPELQAPQLHLERPHISIARRGTEESASTSVAEPSCRQSSPSPTSKSPAQLLITCWAWGEGVGLGVPAFTRHDQASALELSAMD